MQVRRSFGKGNYFVAANRYDDPPLSFRTSLGNRRALTTRAVGTYVRPRLLSGWSEATALHRAAKVGSMVATFAFAALNFVDLASDVAVAVELFQDAHPRWGSISIVITLLSLLLSVLMLLVERR